MEYFKSLIVEGKTQFGTHLLLTSFCIPEMKMVKEDGGAIQLAMTITMPQE